MKEVLYDCQNTKNVIFVINPSYLFRIPWFIMSIITDVSVCVEAFSFCILCIVRSVCNILLAEITSPKKQDFTDGKEKTF